MSESHNPRVVTAELKIKIGLRIRAARDKKGLTVEELSRQIEVLSGGRLSLSTSRFSNYERGGRQPSPEIARYIGEALGVSPSYLLCMTDNESNGAKIYPSNVESAPALSGSYPLISWVQAGNWSEIADHYQPGDAEDWMPCPKKIGSRSYVLRIKGASMEPKFHEGELIYVDPDAQPENGKYVVVRLDDKMEATFKQLILEGGRRYLKALNPAWPEPFIEINGNATICGVVVAKAEVF